MENKETHLIINEEFIVTQNPNFLPTLTIICVTNANSTTEAESLPVLTVSYNGEEYTIENFEEIGKVLARCFQNLGTNYQNALKMSVNLQRIGVNSNSR